MHRPILFAALSMLGHVPTVTAQEIEARSGDAPEDGDIVVTGTRSSGRRALDSSAPIDVVSAEALTDTGYPDLGRALNTLQPSLNFPRAATTATAANTRPVTLRGLSPDQTLVLVNGKRRAANAVLNVNNSIGRGAAAVDLDTIPEAAIERIEVLRDGAAAQYGSDAIAGVVNIILKSNPSGGNGELLGGITEAGDGATALASASAGLALGDGGHVTGTVSARYGESTNRALVDQRFGRITYRIGDPRSVVASGALDAALPLGDAELYAFGTATHKESDNGTGFRVAGFSILYPEGFLPIIAPTITDLAGTIGIRAEVADIRADLSQGFGENRADFRVHDTANVSLGAASPTRFDSGGVRYRQWVTDLTLSRALDGVLAGGNVAVGGQYRHEGYRIRSGEPAVDPIADVQGRASVFRKWTSIHVRSSDEAVRGWPILYGPALASSTRPRQLSRTSLSATSWSTAACTIGIMPRQTSDVLCAPDALASARATSLGQTVAPAERAERSATVTRRASSSVIVGDQSGAA